MSNAIRSESELLRIVRKAIEVGFTPILEINGEYYDFPLSYLMTNGDKCAWCHEGICGIANVDENPKCNGTVAEINRCRRIK